MAGYRQFHTQFWKDEWVIELEPLERYLYSYLFTNDLSSISGIFKLPLRVIQNETGLDRDFILASFKKFQDAQKIFYKDGVMWVVNMKKYHKNASPRTMVKVNNDIGEIPDCDVKTAYLYYEKTGKYSIDTVSILNSERLSVSVSENKSEKESEIPPAPPNVFAVYEQEIGPLTKSISDSLEVAEKDYTAFWVVDALKEASKNNKRSLNYALAILRRWKAEGKTDRKGEKQPAGPTPGTPVKIVLPSGEVVEATA